MEGDEFWQSLSGPKSKTYSWDPRIHLHQTAALFYRVDNGPRPRPADVEQGRALLVLGDSVTTDHISPAGAIPREYPAGQYLEKLGVAPEDFNSYGSRRGNHDSDDARHFRQHPA